MNVYIQTDIEGIAGWTSFEDFGNESYVNYQHILRMRRLLTGEVNAAVRAANACGAQRVLVNDSHGTGYNILFEDLEENCEINHGRGNSYPTWLPGLDDGFDVMLLVGMHAMGGELDGVCPHSKWEVNGGELYLSEASMAMALAGDLGIATVFVSGDNVITQEAKQKKPEIETAVVKHAYGPFCCRSLQPGRAQKLIFERVSKGLTRREEITPFRLDGPLTLNLLDSDCHIPPLKPILENDVVGDSITEAFEKAIHVFPWSKYGTKIVDHYRYPTNLSAEKPADSHATSQPSED